MEAYHKSITGKIHSFESMSTNDGPGIRSVLFFQGCPLRCDYCHNPDTWELEDGEEWAVEELVQKIKRYRSYYRSSSGGVTFSGGEPLMQPRFLLELLEQCHKNRIHTAIETSGYGTKDPLVCKAIIDAVDLVILDVKAFEDTPFVQVLLTEEKPIWLRHVIIPGINDDADHIRKVYDYSQKFQSLVKVELIPYHDLGVYKYVALNIPYPLANLVVKT